MKFASLADVDIRDIEAFFYEEAALLDEHRFEAWLDVFTPDAISEIPATDRPEGGRGKCFALVNDDAARRRSRVKQLVEGWNLGESPPSRTRRFITNVRLVERSESRLAVAANFAVYRFRHELAETFVGRFENELVLRDGALKLQHRRAVLDHEALRPHGKLTILL